MFYLDTIVSNSRHYEALINALEAIKDVNKGIESNISRVNKLNVKINFDDILVIESLKDYIKIVTKNKNFIVHTTLTSFTESLPRNKFIRIHRSTTAAINKIDVIDGSNAYINKTPYKIGGSYKESFKNLVVNFN